MRRYISTAGLTTAARNPYSSFTFLVLSSQLTMPPLHQSPSVDYSYCPLPVLVCSRHFPLTSGYHGLVYAMMKGYRFGLGYHDRCRRNTY